MPQRLRDVVHRLSADVPERLLPQAARAEGRAGASDGVGTAAWSRHEIPAKQPSQEPGAGTHPVNEAERRLRHLLLAAGFEEGIRGEQIRLDPAIGTTTPDVIYRAPHHGADEGVCIYLDGLSGHLHGNAATAEQDRAFAPGFATTATT